MTREKYLIALGVCTVLTPFSGLPSAIESPLIALFGIGIVLLAYHAQKVRDREHTVYEQEPITHA